MRLLKVAVAVFMILACACATAFADDSMSGALLEVLHEQGVINDARYGEIKKAGETGGEQAMTRQLLEVLHEGGTISDEAYQRLVGKADAEKAAREARSAEAVSSPRATPTGDRPAEQAFEAVEEGFARLNNNNIKLKIGAWMEGGYSYDANGSSAGALPGSSTVNTNSGNQFYVRFARPYFNFSFKEKIGFRLVLDATGAPPLRDMYIWFDYIPYTRVTFGQFLTPFGSEVWRAPFENPMINYSLASTLMQFPNLRDIGVMVASKYSTEVAGMPLGAGVSVALINGSGMNNPDDNDHKDVIGRAWVEPFLPGLQVGGSWFVGKSTFKVGNRDWDRWAAEVNYKPSFLKGLALRGEYLFQRKFYETPNRMVHSEGWYAQASYRPSGLDGGLSFLNDVETSLRYEELDEDTAIADNTRTRLTAGVNYWFNKYLRLMVNYESISADSGLEHNPSASNMPKGIYTDDDEVVTTHLQIWF